MKLSKNSMDLIKFFSKNVYVDKITMNQRTRKTLSTLYYEIVEANSYLISLKRTGKYYTRILKKLNTAADISKPNNFNS
jgi:hypothetical protein